ncbi:MAG: GNAT family N-acetyltransferase, partial [Huintestinicola sp.]
RFYTAKGTLASGNILLYNATAVIGGNFTDIAELDEFITMNAPLTIELPADVAVRLHLDGYSAVSRTMFRVEIGDGDEEDIMAVEKELADPVSFERMYDILDKSFEGMDFSLWYTDISHRTRHGVTMPLVYKNASCLSVDFSDEYTAYASCVATLPEERGKGYAERLLRYTASKLRNKKLELMLWADESSRGYYERLGFHPADDDIMLVRK